MTHRRLITLLLTALGLSLLISGIAYGLDTTPPQAAGAEAYHGESILAAVAWEATPVADDPLVRMPGTQPGQVTLEGPNRCLNCHAGYDQAVEPGFNWQGSMMAQAGRDFLFWACLAVAGQDSIWAIGSPNAVDICERCHFPKGWLEGRSDPPNGSAMSGDDFDGVFCDFCHRMFDPFFETTAQGTREGDQWLDYWDETNLSGTTSSAFANATYLEDELVVQEISLFNGDPFFGTDNLPFSSSYMENAAGQYFVSPNDEKRAPFADAEPVSHNILYSRYHKSKYFCSACHDVSNPVLANLEQDGTAPLTTESEAAYAYYHVERTFSEFMLSDYGQQGGAAGSGAFAPDVFNTSLANNYIAKCQDCHMRDVQGQGAEKDVLVRPDESVEHPMSGLPMHDMTGGNAWVSYVLASTVPGAANYDATNDDLLNQGPATLTLDLSQGQGVNAEALLAGVDRARQMLQEAASIEDLEYADDSGEISFRIQNHTGHKLISGFQEGRRMFVNIRLFDDDELVYEVNPYDEAAGTLKGLDYSYQPDPNGVLPAPQVLDPGSEAYVDELVYEIHPSSTLTDEQKTFHFALATGRSKDNRIPPKGFRINEAVDRLAEPVWEGEPDVDYFSAAEYAGGYDAVSLVVPVEADYVEVNLYYQTTSREYIEFLRDEINGDAATLPAEAYIIQSDPFFSQLKAWGTTLWDLWTHNMDVPGAEPLLMTQATEGVPIPSDTPTPTPTGTATPTPTTTATPTATATTTSTPTVTATATQTATPTATVTGTTTTTATATVTQTATATQTQTSTPDVELMYLYLPMIINGDQGAAPAAGDSSLWGWLVNQVEGLFADITGRD